MMDRRNFISIVGFGTVGALIGAQRAFAATPEIYANSATSVAINGADSVGYFTKGDLIYGVEEFSTGWRGATWLFASAENREMFVADPEKYAPQYGGYCAFALAHNAIATTVPEAWSVHKDKLYLNYSLSVRDQWRTDPDGFVARADANWPDVLG